MTGCITRYYESQQDMDDKAALLYHKVSWLYCLSVCLSVRLSVSVSQYTCPDVFQLLLLSYARVVMLPEL